MGRLDVLDRRAMTNGRAVRRTAVEAVVLALCLGVAATACNDTTTPNSGVVKPTSTRPVTPLVGGDILPPGEPTRSATVGDTPKGEPTPPPQLPAPAPVQHPPPEDGAIPPPQLPAPAPVQHPPPEDGAIPPPQLPAPAPVQHPPPEDGAIPPPPPPAPAPVQHPPPNVSAPIQHPPPNVSAPIQHPPPLVPVGPAGPGAGRDNAPQQGRR
jgi:hypothetical protein